MKTSPLPDELKPVCRNLSEPIVFQNEAGDPGFVLLRWEDFISTDAIEEEELSPEEKRRILDIEAQVEREGAIPVEDILKKHGFNRDDLCTG